MAKHTQTIRRQKPTNCLSVCNFHFVGFLLKGLSIEVVIELIPTRQIKINRSKMNRSHYIVYFDTS